MKLNKSYWLKITPIISSLVVLSLLSCKKEVTKVEITENNKQVNNSISFELPSKRGTNTHHRKGAILPFENSYLPIPEDFTGTTFSLKHDYPVMGSVDTPETYPWRKAIGKGEITQKNALKYVNALKDYISKDMTDLLFNYNKSNPNEKSWYQSIWLGSVREPIHGMYVGSNFNPGTLGSTQKDSLTTYVYTLYDKTAAQTLNNIWGTDSINAYKPNLKDVKKTQYAEGSVIVKFAFVNYNNANKDWPPLEGSAAWEVYTDVLAGYTVAKKGTKPAKRILKLMQLDIIVKDSQASPETGWVFSTLVYDKDARGGKWNKMIPLGATWGNNPEKVTKITKTKALVDAKVPAPIDPTLTENWINPDAPSYTIQTLGWGGRLSGPNDGAVFNTGPVTTSTSGMQFKHGGVSTVGCLGCHSTAQYKFNSFLTPIVFPIPNFNKTELPLVYDPGSKNWNRWFRNNNGETPFDLGKNQIGLDYDMVTAFKAIPLWQAAMKNKSIN